MRHHSICNFNQVLLFISCYRVSGLLYILQLKRDITMWPQLFFSGKLMWMQLRRLVWSNHNSLFLVHLLDRGFLVLPLIKSPQNLLWISFTAENYAWLYTWNIKCNKPYRISRIPDYACTCFQLNYRFNTIGFHNNSPINNS